MLRGPGRRSRLAHRQVRAAVEACEPRVLFSTFVVSNGHDSGIGTFRQAILDADATPNSTIVFHIPKTDFSFDSTNHFFQIIPLGNALPALTAPTTVDGTSEFTFLSPDATLNGNAPLMFVAGAFAGSGVDGLHVTAACRLLDLSIGDFSSSGIFLDGGGGSVVQRCWLGVDPSGAAAGNGIDGVAIANSAGNIIGAAIGTGRFINVIDYNHFAGVEIRTNSRNNVVGANNIGVGPLGIGAAGNAGSGVVLRDGANHNSIGGSGGDERNVISANGGSGVVIEDPATTANVVVNNDIGVDSGGRADGNTRDGVTITNAPGNVIGRASDFQNVISANAQNGVSVSGAAATSNQISNDLIGTNQNGTAAIPNRVGVLLSTSQNTVGDPAALTVISGNTLQGIRIAAGASNNTIESCTVGLNGAGSAAIANGQAGVFVMGDHNTVGGDTPSQRNVISGNASIGVAVSGAGATGNVIEGNYIGTDAPGTHAVPNAGGVEAVNGATGTLFSANLISGNTTHGIGLFSGAAQTQMLGNRIGIDALGAALGNGQEGVLIEASGNSAGGSAPGQPNTIADNGGAGIAVGLPPSGTNYNGNAIFDNSVHDNGGLGIDLGDDGVTAPDIGTPPGGPNDLQSFPVINQAATGASRVAVNGQLNSIPNADFVIDVYASPAADPSGYGEGQVWLGSTPAHTNSAGFTVFAVNLPAPIPVGWVASATATRSGTFQETSEFSQAVPLIDQTRPPKVATADFDYVEPDHRLTFNLDEEPDPTSALASAVQVRNLTTGATLVPVAVSTGGRQISLAFGSPVPDGRYRATILASHVTNLVGTQLDGNGDGTPGDNYTFDFFYLTADVNHDGTVNFSDLLILAQHYGTGTQFGQGDINYDGSVNFDDLLLLAQHYGRGLPPAAASASIGASDAMGMEPNHDAGPVAGASARRPRRHGFA